VRSRVHGETHVRFRLAAPITLGLGDPITLIVGTVIAGYALSFVITTPPRSITQGESSPRPRGIVMTPLRIDLAWELNVLAASAAFVFVGSIILGIF
jgi:hypothetical protein